MSLSDKNQALGPADFLLSVGLGRGVIELQPEQVFFTQGDPADSVFCLKEGRAKLTVVSPSGKQATITLLSPGDFFGEESLAAASGPRLATATAVNRCMAIEIKREEMIRAMHQEPAFCDRVLSFLVTRGMRTQADLVDQIFNSSEKRLARTLLLMAESAKPNESRTLIPPVTQETLAEMIGTTRSRVNFFMNRFRNLGLIEYKDRIQVHKPRLKAVLVDQFAGI
jgi:CRP-like cAMP-binding protein